MIMNRPVCLLLHKIEVEGCCTVQYYNMFYGELTDFILQYSPNTHLNKGTDLVYESRGILYIVMSKVCGSQAVLLSISHFVCQFHLYVSFLLVSEPMQFGSSRTYIETLTTCLAKHTLITKINILLTAKGTAYG